MDPVFVQQTVSFLVGAMTSMAFVISANGRF